MFRRFSSASAVASIVIGLAALGLRFFPAPSLQSRYLLTTIWCVVPAVWGLWAIFTPKAWLPQRLPLWGAILGLIAGVVAAFVLDLPSQFAGEPVPASLRGLAVFVAAVLYYFLWMVVRGAYRSLAVPAPPATFSPM